MAQSEFRIEGNVLVRYTGNAKDVVVPPEVEVIGEKAFRNNRSIRNVVLSDSLEVIRKGAFSGSGLQSIRIPPRVKELPEQAFHKCGQLTDLRLSEGLEGIGKWCFFWCNNLKSLQLPDSLRHLAPGAFAFSSFETLRIPPRVRELPGGAFSRCEQLTDLQLSEGLEGIGTQCFFDCHNLRTLRLPDSLRHLAPRAFAGSSVVSLRVPPRVQELPRAAFHGCEQLEDLQLPEGLEKIGAACFYLCTGLRSLRLPDSLRDIEEYAFGGTRLRSLRVPPLVRELPYKVFSYCVELRDLQLPDNLKIIRKDAFECSDLPFLRIPPAVAFLPAGAFRGCAALKVVELHGNLSSIDGEAFDGCEKLKTVRFPSTVSAAPEDVLQPLVQLGLECLDAPGIPLAALPPELRHPGAIGKANWLAEEHPLTPELRADLDAYLKEQWPTFLREAASHPALLRLLLANRLLTRPAVDVLLSRVAGTDQPEAMALLLAYQGQLPLPDPEEQLRQALWEMETGALLPDTFDASWSAYPVEGGGLVLAEYHGEEKGDILLPAGRGDTPVVALGDGLFEGNPHIVSVTIPEGVRTMGEKVFARCRSLQNVELPSTLKELPKSAFEGCVPCPDVHRSPGPGTS